MTAQEIVDRYQQQPASDLRLQKAFALAKRFGVDPAEVQKLIEAQS